MTIRFAAAGSGECRVVAQVLRYQRPERPANDCEAGFARSVLLQSALRHFARHGLTAAQRARHEAERAYLTGDMRRYRHWMAVWRKLTLPADDGPIPSAR